MIKRPFGELFLIPLRNGINRPSRDRGVGYKMINMGEIFKYDRLYDIPMELVLLNEREINSYHVLNNDLIFARQSIVAEGAGKCSIVLEVSETVTCFESHIIRVRLNEKIASPLYYYYFFQSDLGKGYLSGIRQQGVQAGIRGSDLARLKLPYPPLPTQRKTALILTAYDDLIENNLKRIKLLEEMAQKTYEEWFVKFRIDGKQLPIDKETGLPDGWDRVKLGENIKFIKGKKVGELFDEKIEGSEKVLLLDALEDGKFKFTKIGNHTQTKRGDIMMLMDGARSSHVFYSENGIIGSTMAKIVSVKIPPTLLYSFFKNIYEWLKINNTGAAIPHANKSFINGILFVLPSDTILVKWNHRINVINNKVWNLRDQNQNLKEARDILLPRLMTGMIDVEKM